VKNYDFNSINFDEKYFSEVDKIKKQEILALFAELSQLRELIDVEVYNLFNIPEKIIEKIDFHFLKY
jgi:hypothetical protein